MIESTQSDGRHWRVYNGGQDGGPYTRAEVDSFLQNGQLAADAMLLGPGMTEWQPAFAAPAAPPSSPVQTVGYATQTRGRQAPAYSGITTGAALLAVLGGILIAVGLLILAIRLLDKAGAGDGLMTMLIGVGLLVYGIMMIFVASLGSAIRDIARNSFRW